MKIKISVLSSIIICGLTACSSTLSKHDIQYPESYRVDLLKYSDKQTESITNWWEQFNTPLLIELISSAQLKSPDLASAVVNIKNYELSVISTQSKNIPSLDFNSSGTKSLSSPNLHENTTSQYGFRTSWELDLFQKNANASTANSKRLNAAKSSWHDARTLVAAQTAKSFFNYKYCNNYVVVSEMEYRSKLKQHELIKLNIKAGLDSPSSENLSTARLNNIEIEIESKKTECLSELKGLVALTGIEEQELQNKLNNETLHDYTLFIPISIPSDLITQRPDVYAAKMEIEASIANHSSVSAEKYPSLSFTGNIGSMNMSSMGSTFNGNVWSIGPISISLPIFDGGVQKTKESLAVAQYNKATIVFDSVLRNAIKDVEVSLLTLQNTNFKLTKLKTSSENYKLYLNNIELKYKAGLVNLTTLEDARISYFTSLKTIVDNDKQRVSNWIDLYKAVGGSFKEGTL